METLTVKDMLWLLAAITTVISFYKLIKKPFEDINSSLKKIEKQNDDNKKEIDGLRNDFRAMQKDVDNHGDMIYTMLDHLATNNNTGNMKRCLDAYNEYNRHN